MEMEKKCFSGIYKTKERALEILDEIQKLLTFGAKGIFKVHSKLSDQSFEKIKSKLGKEIIVLDEATDYQPISPQNIIYEMPLE